MAFTSILLCVALRLSLGSGRDWRLFIGQPVGAVDVKTKDRQTTMLPAGSSPLLVLQKQNTSVQLLRRQTPSKARSRSLSRYMRLTLSSLGQPAIRAVDAQQKVTHTNY